MPNNHAPNICHVEVAFTPRGWYASSGPLAYTQYGFKVYWVERAGWVSVDLIECPQAEPIWSRGDVGEFLEVLRNEIQQATGKEVARFRRPEVLSWGCTKE